MRLSTLDSTALLSEQVVEHFAYLGWQAMLAEVNLTPKPGLVDQFNTGAHKDMALSDFHLSAVAIANYFPDFIHAGALSAQQPISTVLAQIRPIGIDCEKAMFQATVGVNTHKGTIFSLGLVLTAIGRLLAQQQTITAFSICQLVAQMCQGITQELKKTVINPTAGQRLYHAYGFTGARGEAEAGYPLVTQLSLPHYLSCLANGISEPLALLETLILLMAHNDDTNIANRGGITGLLWTKDYAQQLLSQGGITTATDFDKVRLFDRACIAKNLSPGGSADLLILTWFLAQLSNANNPMIKKQY